MANNIEQLGSSRTVPPIGASCAIRRRLDEIDKRRREITSESFDAHAPELQALADEEERILNLLAGHEAQHESEES